MNKRMEQEIGENNIEKHGHRWKLIPRVRRDFAAATEEEQEIDECVRKSQLLP